MSSVKGLGHFDGRTHVLPLRVYYEDTDLSGVVYHANYLRFMERGRTEFFRCAGIWLAKLDGEEPVAWALRNARLAFHRPARLDDPIEVRSVFDSIGGARITARQTIHSGDTLLVEGWVEACIVTLNGRPRRIPGDVRDRLIPFLAETNA
jgi:acyl-CoA thioester hydrolase